MDSVNEYPRQLVDENGCVHLLHERPLGQGGQGIVFRTRDDDTAVKMVTDPVGRPIQGNSQEHQRLCGLFEEVRLLPLPSLHLAKPLAMLKEPYVGYVMRLLNGMVPIGTLLAKPGSSLGQFYLEGGGLTRRLRLLAKTAETLARLHAIPLVYADISPNNIFVSQDVQAAEAWLIDADNLHFASSAGPAIYTPGFGAPELLQGKSGVNTLTDVHAFAVLAFQVLVQHHPFLGDYVEEAGGWDADDDLENKAFAGEVPWIDDAEDNLNYTEKGIFPRDMVLSPRLQDLFQVTFGLGRCRPTTRPGMQRWVETLHQAADSTVVCLDCRSSFYPKTAQCPWCGNGVRDAFVYVRACRWDPELDADEFDIATGGKYRDALPDIPAGERSHQLPLKVVWHKVLVPGRDDFIERHVVSPTLFADGDPPALEVRFSPNTFTITPTDGGVYFAVATEARTCVRLDKAHTIRLSDLATGWYLHCGPLDQPHRLLAFTYHPKASHAC